MEKPQTGYLGYGTLTVMLVVIYEEPTDASALVHFIGQEAQSSVVIVGSTSAIAGLFQPLRFYIQKLIDRRFYRRTYDAARTREAFSHRYAMRLT